MRVELKGIHKVKVRLADGSTTTYCYAWRGGPRIKAEYGSADFHRQYNEAVASRRKPTQGLLFTLIAEFKTSAEFTVTAESTQRAYLSYLKLIEEEFGDMPIKALDDPGVKGDFMAWRDTMANTPRKADYAWVTLQRVLSVAKKRGRIAQNPCEDAGRLYQADRTEMLWTEADIARLLSVAGPEMELALMLALWTGQRQIGLLRMRWSDIDGTHVKLPPRKRGKPVRLPLGAPLAALLKRTERKSPMVMTNTYGRPWTSDGFRSSWGKLCERAGIEGLTFHDLRGSAITRLALAGASPLEIASVTGHSIIYIGAMLDRHYLGERAQLAENAIHKLERKQAK